MSTGRLVFDEAVAQIAKTAVAGMDDSRMERIIDLGAGHQDGFLVESFLERVVVFSAQRGTLSLSDVSDARRAMTKAQARRAMLCVPAEASIPNAVLLLATLSKIEIVRVTAADAARHAPRQPA
jgi:hypothetical protein